MKKVSLMLVAAALTAVSAQALTVKERHAMERPAGGVALNIMENSNLAPVQNARNYKVQAGAETLEFELIPTGISINDPQAQQKLAAQRAARRANSGVIIEEYFQNFTQGSQNSPYGPVNNDGGQIPSSMHPNSPNLYGWGVYSCGGWAMLRAAFSGAGATGYPEFRITGIDLTVDLTDIEIGVAALTQNCVLAFVILDANQNKAITNEATVNVPYDGEFYTLKTSKNAVKNLVNAQLMVYEQGSQDIAIGGFYLEGGIGSGASGGGGGTGGGGGGGDIENPNQNDTQVGKVTGVNHTVARDKQSFNVNWNTATNATSYNLKVYNDVITDASIRSLKVLDLDYSGVKGGASDPYNPNLNYWKNPVMYLDAMPGGCVHHLVLLNGAIGFVNLPSYMDTQYYAPGFETDTYDLSPTHGVCTLKFDYYATIGCGILLYEVAYNEQTCSWDIVDSMECDETNGELMIESDEDSPWDYLEITMDRLGSQYSGEVKFLVGVYSVLGETDDYIEDPYNAPVFFYIKSLSIEMNDIPAGSDFYYTYYDNPAITKTSVTVNGDVPNNYFNYTVRGVNTNEKGTAFGPWAVDDTSDSGTFYVRPRPASNAIEAVGVDNNAPAVYYNLQGVRVDNPQGGLYIVKRGDKATKVLVK